MRAQPVQRPCGRAGSWRTWREQRARGECVQQAGGPSKGVCVCVRRDSLCLESTFSRSLELVVG